MNDLDKIKQAKNCLESLVKGIDPNTGEAVGENCVVRDTKVISCLKTAVEALEHEIQETANFMGSDKKQGRKAFFITEAQFRKLSLNNGECKVSDIAKEINRVTEGNGTNTMQAVWINNWLESVGLLLRNSDGNRVATESGQAIGIKSVLEHTANVPDNYTNYYSLHAQTYIYDHLRDILAHHFGE
jgi:hypothetical protein